MRRLLVTTLKQGAAAALLAPSLLTAPASAQGCRAQQIMASQCTWFALEELGGSKSAAAQAQHEATSTLINGCSQGEYQMVLLRGTGLSDRVVARLRFGGTREVAAVRRECAAQASQAAMR
jgi:hypothetical protein